MNRDHKRIDRRPFSDLSGFGSLFTTYCDDFDQVAEFYPRDYRSPDDLVRAAEVAAAYPRNRALLVAQLREQNIRFGAGEASLDNIERLGLSGSSAVVTGQQVGLFTGPMYTVLKTATTIQLAARVEELTGNPCVPVFWLEGEDHDFEEASTISVPGPDGMHHISMSHELNHNHVNHGPVGRINLDESVDGLIASLQDALPATEFVADIIGAVRGAYAPGTSVRDAFAFLMRRFFPTRGLVFAAPDSPDLKRSLSGLVRKEIEDHETSFALLERRTREIGERFKPQISPQPVNLFLLEDEGRLRLNALPDGSFGVKGVNRSYSVDQLLGMLERDPQRFSPNVCFRPICQDILLPTAAYVAGPGEISYFAQLGPLYEWAGVPMPVIYPRASVTFVEPRIRKVLDRYGLSVHDLAIDLDATIRSLVMAEMDVDLDAVFSAFEAVVTKEFAGLQNMISQTDKSLERSAEGTLAGFTRQLGGLKAKVIRAAKRNQEQMTGAVHRAAEGLYPGGGLQERTISPLYWMAKFGLEFTEDLLDLLDLDTTEHQVIDL